MEQKLLVNFHPVVLNIAVQLAKHKGMTLDEWISEAMELQAHIQHSQHIYQLYLDDKLE
ncbi:hypothetical protein DEDE109153_10710 [Deinococcus deserti]|uniref:hypothetical protein n=1 Tax=Deinococcus deserti TaxID=310783 RepID=UPI00139245AF|nr:hypothetical protein [Deinococcus deserti]